MIITPALALIKIYWISQLSELKVSRVRTLARKRQTKTSIHHQLIRNQSESFGTTMRLR
jgi:hypothetical protein